jgi:hypothetical protein
MGRVHPATQGAPERPPNMLRRGNGNGIENYIAENPIDIDDQTSKQHLA